MTKILDAPSFPESHGRIFNKLEKYELEKTAFSQTEWPVKLQVAFIFKFAQTITMSTRIVTVFLSLRLGVEFLLKIYSGYPKDTGVTAKLSGENQT